MTLWPAKRLRLLCRAATSSCRKAAPFGRPLLIPLLVLLTLLVPPPLARTEIPSTPEYQVKAAFLYNFMKFVDWPGDGARATAPICLGILGRDPFGAALDSVKGKLAKGRKVVIAHFRKEEEVKECDLLFISDSEKPRIEHILKGLQSSRVLTVADQEGFCEAGGMINLVSVKSKVGFGINLGAAKRAGLHISSQLLNLARTVIE